jgi:transcriptional regulator of acetoin/glycerol metabolism
MILEIEKEITPENLNLDLTIKRQESPSGAGTPVSLDGFVIPETGISFEDMENALVRKALEMSNGNQTKAAQLLKMPRDAFRRRMKRFGIV